MHSHLQRPEVVCRRLDPWRVGAQVQLQEGGLFIPDPNLQLLSAKDWGMNPPSAMKMKPYEPPTGGIPKARTPSTKSADKARRVKRVLCRVLGGSCENS